MYGIVESKIIPTLDKVQDYALYTIFNFHCKEREKKKYPIRIAKKFTVMKNALFSPSKERIIRLIAWDRDYPYYRIKRYVSPP